MTILCYKLRTSKCACLHFLLSIKQHIQWQSTLFHTKNNGVILTYPTFAIDMVVQNEIEHLIQPLLSHTSTFYFDKANTTVSLYSNTVITHRLVTSSVIQHIPQPHHHQQFTNTAQSQKLAPEVCIPAQATKGSIGYNIKAICGQTAQPGEITKIKKLKLQN